jgi:hypothetical protein
MARNKETVLWNAYQKAVRQTERGAEDPVTAYVIPASQHDSRTMELMVEKLMAQKLEIYRAKNPFTGDGAVYEEGSYVIPLAQPKMGLVKTLLSRTRFPDDSFTRMPDGSPHRPYDTATDTMAEFMGVEVYPMGYITEVELELLQDYKPPVGAVDESSKVGYLLDTRENHAFKAVNMLMAEGVPVKRVTEPLMAGDFELPPGCFIVEPGHEERLTRAAEANGVSFHALAELRAETKPVKPQRVGMYQRYWGGNMDEGWTRLCLEQYCFNYATLMDEEIKKGSLRDGYDVIILPSDSPAMITGGDELKKWWKEHRQGWELPEYPPEYRSGLGDEGKKALKEFVEKGGTLVCLGDSSMYAVEALELKVANVLEKVPSREFHCPGSTIHMDVDTEHPVAYGMQEEALALFWNSPAFKIIPSPDNHRYSVIASYPESDLLESGWLVGEEMLANKIAALQAESGLGRAVLIGFRCQHRCQTGGTFKLLFNSLLG